MKLTKKKTLWGVVFLIVTNDQTASAQEGLKMEASSSVTARVSSIHLRSHRDQMIVSGVVRRGLPLGRTPGEHVDVQLVEASGRVLAEKMDQVTERSTPRHTTFHRQSSYAVRFPRKTLVAAAKVRVAYHLRSHQDCVREKKS